MDIIYFVLYAYFFCLTIEAMRDSKDISAILIESYKIWILNITLLGSYKSFIMKIMQMTINIISLFLTLSAWDMNFQLMMIFDASGLTVFTIFLIYYQ